MKALVTGAARGLGAAIAERLRADGVAVLTLDLASGCDLQLDVASDEFPPLEDIDVCVANAGITTTIAPSHTMALDHWRRDLDVNLTGAFRTVQACLPGMRRRSLGRIVAISSVAARSGLPGQIAYSASKAGLLGMVRTLAAEYAHEGITANAVLPGMVATEVVKAMPQRVRDAVIASLPTGRMAEPAEVAALVSFLASPEAAQVTGQAIAVEGGWSLNTRSLTGRGGPAGEAARG